MVDGRSLSEDPNPTWWGYSIGHWVQDTLVVETAGFNDRTWLDFSGHPHGEELRVIERFQRRDFEHTQLQMTFDDPKTFAKPFTEPRPERASYLTFFIHARIGPETVLSSVSMENTSDI